VRAKGGGIAAAEGANGGEGEGVVAAEQSTEGGAGGSMLLLDQLTAAEPSKGKCQDLMHIAAASTKGEQHPTQASVPDSRSGNRGENRESWRTARDGAAFSRGGEWVALERETPLGPKIHGSAVISFLCMQALHVSASWSNRATVHLSPDLSVVEDALFSGRKSTMSPAQTRSYNSERYSLRET
jgi:hypothetical protein